MSKAAKMAALARLKKSKQGDKLADVVEIEDAKPVFTEISEEAYNKLQTERATDSFIEGGSGLGYEETGMDDDWGVSMEDEKKRKKADRKAKQEEKAAQAREKKERAQKKAQAEKRRQGPGLAQKNTLLNYAQPKLNEGAAAVSVQTSGSTDALASTLLGNIFGGDTMEVDEDPTAGMATPAVADPLAAPFGGVSPAPATNTTASPLTKPPRKKIKSGSQSADTTRSLNSAIGSMAVKSPAISSKVQDRPPPTMPRRTGPNSALNVSSLTGTTLNTCSASPELAKASLPAQAEGRLNMYLLDMFEDKWRNPGTVYLFGKVPAPGRGFESCCVVVKNIQRTVFFLPRLKPLNDAGEEQDAPEMIDEKEGRVKMMKVYQEMNALRRKYGIHGKVVGKPVTRGFCFRVRGEYGVPAECKVLKVEYPFSDPELERNDTKYANTYSHIFGTRDTAMELLILKRKIKGPGWISIPDTSKQGRQENVSWAKRCLYLDGLDGIEYDLQQAPPPPLRVLSLGMQTVLDSKNNHEVLCLSWVVHNSVNVEGPTPNTQPQDRQIMCRKHNGQPYPADLQAVIKKRGINIPMKFCNSEKELLNLFLNKVQLADPDFIVGHNLYKFGLDVLLTRMRSLRMAKSFSKIGRLRRSKFPFKSSGGLRQDVAPGRLMADTWSSAQEFVRQKNFSLVHLAEVYKLEQNPKPPLELNTIPQLWTASANSLLQVVEKTLIDAGTVLKLLFKLEILPQTKQMTCLCGNLWQASLRSQRARRNEYMLMHSFYEQDYVLPEKYTKKEKIRLGIVADKSKGKRKPDYEGGLVLEPKRGFYDKYIILLDFNSLYPSCIQEYNLCFTTCEHWKKGKNDKVECELPQPQKEGILPRVITYLLNSRKAVKNMMKKERDPEKKKMFDIRQKALKLVANSMYGCLGFSTSRFYAKPIAALITAMGRENLQRAKDVAELKCNKEVVYGDTDSIMVYTDESDFRLAYKVGVAIRKEANKGYKHMYLEVDDVFKKMLLLRKKKYAALKEERIPGGTKLTQEKKGLDLVRRDWSLWSKELGTRVLDIIMGELDMEQTIDAILEYLRAQRELLEAGKVPEEQFVITKKLTKAPQHYADAAKQAHVQVALRMMKRGVHVGSGAFIPYVICKGENAKSLAQNAYHLDEVRNSRKPGETLLEIDRKFYLEKQIMPPTGRLCDPIKGLEMGQIAEALGLDTAKYASRKETGGEDDDDEEFCNSIDAARSPDMFENVDQLMLRCPGATTSTNVLPFEGLFKWSTDGRSNFGGMVRRAEDGTEQDESIPEPKRRGDPSKTVSYRVGDVWRLKNQLTRAVRQQSKKYYQREMRCSDSTCNLTTRQMCVRGTKCPQTGCSGTMEFTTTDKELYEQLRYFTALFKFDTSKKRLEELKTQNPGRYKDATGQLEQHELEAAREIARHADNLCKQSGYHYVDFAKLGRDMGFQMRMVG